MRGLVCIIAVAAVAASAHAACEFPYYPEFADVFGRYDEVTPEMAIAGIGAWPEEATTFVEPLLLHEANGMPYCYMIEAFPAEDAELVARWNEVVAKLNAGDRLPAAELAAELEELYAVAYAPRPGGSVLPTFTFDYPGAHIITEGRWPFPAFYEYLSAYRVAKLRFESGGVFFLSRVVGAGPFSYQIFEFENEAGKKVALARESDGLTHAADLEENAARMREAAGKKYELLIKDAVWAETNRARWEEITAGLQGGESP